MTKKIDQAARAATGETNLTVDDLVKVTYYSLSLSVPQQYEFLGRVVEVRENPTRGQRPIRVEPLSGCPISVACAESMGWWHAHQVQRAKPDTVVTPQQEYVSKR